MKNYLGGTYLWQKCGSCDHYQLSHTNWASIDIDADGLQWEPRCHVTHDGPVVLLEQCRCEEWVPKDNLDRIEFLAEKRHLIK